MNENETDLQQETSRSPVLDGVRRNIQAARKFLDAGGSLQAIEDYEKDCGTYKGLDIYLERMMDWLGMNVDKEQGKHGE